MRYKIVAAGAGSTVVETAPTVCRGVIALTTGTSLFSIFDDNITPPSGQKVYASPATVALGALDPWVAIPMSTGIVVTNSALGAELVVVYD